MQYNNVCRKKIKNQEHNLIFIIILFNHNFIEVCGYEYYLLVNQTFLLKLHELRSEKTASP